MPLTQTRSGVFRGRANDVEAWYVIDPAEPDHSKVESDWNSMFAATNRGTTRRIAGAVAGWVIFLSIQSVAITIVITLGELSPVAYLAVAALGFISLIGGAGLGMMVSDKIAPYRPATVSRFGAAAVVPEPVLSWATDATTQENLWDLSVGVARLGEISQAFEYWGIGFDEDRPRPDWAIDTFVGPVLESQFREQRARLVEVADRTGFPIPSDLLELPTGLTQLLD